MQAIEREMTRKSLAHYASAILGHRPARHHLALISRLERVAAGSCNRLMVFMPPGYAKSTYASVAFPGYFIGSHPDRNVVCASHAKDLARSFSRKVRNMVGSEAFYDIFDLRLAADSKSAEAWQVVDADGGRKAEFYAVGVDSSITGKRADGAIIDDPVKGRKQADSELIRNAVWEWYKSDLRTRLKPGAFIILIQTRWHEDDLAGRILPADYAGESGAVRARDGETWEVLNLPAIARERDPVGRAEGECLWPEWYTPAMVEQERITQGPRNWSALYQGVPMPDTGDYFLRGWFRWYDTVPKSLVVYGASDYAVTAGGGDYTVHMIAGVDADDDIYILDVWRGQTDPSVWTDAYIGLVKRWRPVEWGVEQGQINKSVGPFLGKKEQETRTYCYRKPFVSSADKTARAQGIRGRMAQGKVFFPRNADWMPALQGELLGFPAGKHDDQVDAFGLFGRMLTEMSACANRREHMQDTSGYDVFTGAVTPGGAAQSAMVDAKFNVWGEG